MNFPITLVTVFVSVIVLFAFVPMFIEATYETVIVDNEGYDWVKFNYSNNTTVSISVSLEDDLLTIGGPVPQSGPIDDMVIWADNSLSVFIKNGTAYYVGNNAGVVSSGSLSNSFDIIKGVSNDRIVDNGETYLFSPSQWAYIPNANGEYASFKNGVNSVLNNDDYTRAFIGDLMGIYAYNDINTSDYQLSLFVDKNENVLSGAYWGVQNED